MLPEGWTELVVLMDGRPDVDPGSRAERLCALCVRSVRVSGVAMAVRHDGHRSTVCATDDTSGRLEDLQTTFAEGPCIDATDTGLPVLAPDLGGRGGRRWTWFAPAALELGAPAFFAFPLRVGAVSFGALGMYRGTASPLSVRELGDAKALAEAAALVLTLDQPGEDSAQAIRWVLEDRSRFHANVHQAIGMAMVQLDVDAKDAFARICAHAYATSKPLGEVADDVVSRRLVLESP